nr:MAG TPA_asm: hypothetical protein [Caudoviricetes sp.]
MDLFFAHGGERNLTSFNAKKLSFLIKKTCKIFAYLIKNAYLCSVNNKYNIHFNFKDYGSNFHKCKRQWFYTS